MMSWIELGIQVEFTGRADSLKGTIDIPEQGVTGWQLRDVQMRGDSVSFAMPPQGPPASVRGVVRGDSLIGEFLQPPITASLRLLDPGDPVKYDYAMCHLGMMDACGFSRPAADHHCPLRGVCRPRVRTPKRSPAASVRG